MKEKTREEHAWFLEEVMKHLHRAQEAAHKAGEDNLEQEIKDVGLMAKKRWDLLFPKPTV